MSTSKGLHNKVVLFRIRGLTFVSFGLLAAIGAVVTVWLTMARQVQIGLPLSRYLLPLFLSCPLLAVLGSRLLALLIDWRTLRRDPRAALLSTAFAWQGGFVLTVGGVAFVGALLGVEPLLLLDTFALALPLGHAIGRLGCHTYGCCHGKPTRGRVAIVYTNPEAKAVRVSRLGGVALHPAQLYAVGTNLLVFAVLDQLAGWTLPAGLIAASYLMLHSACRFVVERFRGVTAPRWRGLSVYQLIAVGLFVGGALLAAYTGLARAATPVRLGGVAELAPALGLVVGRYGALLLVTFVTIFFAFGVHGRRVGSLARS
ncbi:MAG: prolipoprotein diacylglyceryl transferase [Myxococcales bacterium]|nr:prolipoprotein diacylglyceryl transferase [Myxococcales bacterium]